MRQSHQEVTMLLVQVVTSSFVMFVEQWTWYGMPSYWQENALVFFKSYYT